MTKYANALLMILSLVASALSAALLDGQVSQVEGVNVAIAFFGAVGVWLAPVTPAATYVKWAMAFVVAGLMAATTYIGVGGVQSITGTELFQILAAAIAATVAAATSPKTTPALLRAA